MDSTRYSKVSKKTLTKIKTILTSISADIDFDLFHDVMGLVYIETHGTVAGFELLNEWAKSSGSDIPTGKALWACWSGYQDDNERYFGMYALLKLAERSKKKRKK